MKLRFRYVAFLLITISMTHSVKALPSGKALIPDAYTNRDSWEQVKKRVPIANPSMLSQNPAFDFVEADAALPNVLLIGDSISIGYTIPVRERLAGKANVYRVPTNGGWTYRGLQELSQWLSDVEWDVIHFNWGLHDLKRHNPLVTDGVDDRQGTEDINDDFLVTPELYRQNLHKLVSQLKLTNAKLIWASTTPVPGGTVNRISSDELAYNAIANGVMAAHSIEINDLHAAMRPHLKEFQKIKDVHYTPEGSAFLAERVALKIETSLK
ncbi:SGNH/GDSL hydrolase family protein [Lentimonas sp. CC4]|uniref:SGNH/GDSL hydrolase family protein n=2 Tax=Lentimonas TaxID=417293 RepID=UPI00132ABB4E|nr:SGNH/GDSL hydrolase family protein [Lentimonas sp. CC4]CAA6686296.1 Unannotated [Lentimonas sp. CC6]CAA7170935.1 Unannotated [Lentimonas sp. CC21]CAA7181122.1 Unannotated [Lentimonas sp. CC8]CAA6679262.1 Unannotated [Lentimonas sp. CC4]CAA7076072.1 Unannotated [Lentimonas sp. CC4]